MTRAKTLSLNQLMLIFAVTVSLLFAQFAGQHHRIDHTRWQANISLHQLIQAQYDGYDDKHHSCITFDAATLADTVGAAISIALLAPGTHMLAQWIDFISWDAPLTLHFLSRAPPPFR
jgi:hypothetical protein